MSIGLTPAGRPRWAPLPGDDDDAPRLRRAFDDDWREALFTMAAEGIDLPGSPVLPFWREIADRHLTALCQVPDDAAPLKVPGPPTWQWAKWAQAAPPMVGGEHLSVARLRRIWRDLSAWASESAQAAGGLAAFLAARAPRWRQVGRICFHLAEHPHDEARPFAFLATWGAGFDAAGRMQHQPLLPVMRKRIGVQGGEALAALLAPLRRAAGTCDWVRELVQSGDVYLPLAWPPERAMQLLGSAPALEEAGLSLRLPDWWRRGARPRVEVTIGARTPARLDADAVLDFDVDVTLGDDTLTRDELEALLDGDDGLVRVGDRWAEVDRERLRQALDHWQEMQRRARKGGLSFIEGMRLLAGAPADLQDEAEEERQWAHVAAGEAMREVLRGMRQPDALAPAEIDGDLRGALRPYQRDGLTWLRFLSRLGLGACLADDMGLGKTIQVLALLLCERRGAPDGARAPSLLVIPASLLGNWRQEAERFAPTLTLRFLHPAETDRRRIAEIAADPGRQLAGVDLAVTTYAMLVRQPWLEKVRWRLVVLDEAQAVKNPSTRQSRAVRRLPARARIALTGTPVENRLHDLWALFDFLNPGLLGSRAVFQAFVKRLQERPENPFAPLRRLVAPYVLRRLKTDRRIVADLPEKTETTRYCRLTRAQVVLYERVVRDLRRDLEANEGIARRGAVLRALMRLKQVCNHPSQASGDGRYAPADSGKFARLAEVCRELAERGERTLVFTQFREIIDALSAHLAAIFGRPGLALHGGTAVGRRRALVDRFQAGDGPPFFVLSLRAGGTGLNLTAACHVIHFDRWWNPAVENQATDRAFRIGQRRNVLVHKFVTTGTIEERIDRMIEEKKALAADLLDGGREIDVTELSDDELIDLVRLDVTRAQP